MRGVVAIATANTIRECVGCTFVGVVLVCVCVVGGVGCGECVARCVCMGLSFVLVLTLEILN